jgi:hypothetical protein
MGISAVSSPGDLGVALRRVLMSLWVPTIWVTLPFVSLKGGWQTLQAALALNVVFLLEFAMATDNPSCSSAFFASLRASSLLPSTRGRLACSFSAEPYDAPV